MNKLVVWCIPYLDYPGRNSQCVLKKKTNLSPSPLAQQPDLPLAFPLSKNDNIFMGVCLSLTLRILLALFLCHMPFHSQPVPKPHRLFSSVQFSSSVVSDSVTPWIAACQASLSITNSWSSLKLMSIKSVMPSSHLILCRPLLLLPPIPPSIRVFSNESTLHMRWPKYWSFSFSISPSNEHPELISFRMDWLDLLAVQGTLKSLLQHHSSKASILQRSVFFTVHHRLLYTTYTHYPGLNSKFMCWSPKPSMCLFLGIRVSEYSPSWITALHGKGACIIQWNCDPCHAGWPKMDRS